MERYWFTNAVQPPNHRWFLWGLLWESQKNNIWYHHSASLYMDDNVWTLLDDFYALHGFFLQAYELHSSSESGLGCSPALGVTTHKLNSLTKNRLRARLISPSLKPDNRILFPPPYQMLKSTSTITKMISISTVSHTDTSHLTCKSGLNLFYLLSGTIWLPQPVCGTKPWDPNTLTEDQHLLSGPHNSNSLSLVSANHYCTGVNNDKSR